MRASNGASVPRAASVDSAPVSKADWNRRSASNSPASAWAVENCVPLSSASPSFGPSTTGARPTLARASTALLRPVGVSASPTPIITAVMCDSGARSPEAPTEPCAGTTGITPRTSMASSRAQRGRANAGGALRQAGELERHHEPRDRHRGGLAHARAMRQHDVALQFLQVLRGNAHAGQLAKARVDAIDRLAPGDDALHRRGTGGHGCRRRQGRAWGWRPGKCRATGPA